MKVPGWLCKTKVIVRDVSFTSESIKMFDYATLNNYVFILFIFSAEKRWYLIIKKYWIGYALLTIFFFNESKCIS